MNREGNSPPSRQSPYSPFPFGSPLGTMSSRKSPETGGANGLQSSTTSPNRTAFPNNSFLKSRVRAQEAYGGPVMFGGQSSSFRKSRMIAASPYAASANASRRAHQRPLFEDSQSSSRRGSSAANTPSPAPSPSPSSTTSDNGAMSSTARLIFDTLEKMSTPVRDAQKLIPSVSCSPPRAEKRRLIAEQLDWSKDTLKRKRPNLGRDISGRNQLNGPPLRTIFSPVPASPRPRSNAAKSARLTATPKAPSSNVQPQKNLGESFTSKPVSLGAKAFLPTKPKIDLPLPAVNEGKSVIKPFASSTSLSQPATSPSKSLSVPAPSMTKSGKMRTKVSEPLRQKTTAEVEAEPLPNFLATSNASLPLKAMPTFDFGHTKEISASPPISRTSSSMTTTTLPLQRSSSSSDCLEDQNEDASFQFSNPSPVKWSDGRSPDDVVPNGIVFSFCQPKEVAPGSSSKTSPTAKAVYPKNHVQALPDLTMRSNNQQSPVAAPAKSLKQGSVMDILKRDHVLPDVTASAGGGVKTSPFLSNESVMSVLGGKWKP